MFVQYTLNPWLGILEIYLYVCMFLLHYFLDVFIIQIIILPLFYNV